MIKCVGYYFEFTIKVKGMKENDEELCKWDAFCIADRVLLF